MKRIFFDLKSETPLLKESVLTIGCFDGVHKGHQKLIAKVQEESRSRSVPSCLCLFDPHPIKVLKKDKSFKRIFSFDEIEQILESYKIDYLCIIPFNDSFSKQTAEQFIRKIHFQLNPLCFVVGYDFSFGAGKKGTIKDLKREGEKLNFQVKQIEALCFKENPISSSRIREGLSAGQTKEVASLLGYPFFISGQVVKGKGRGHELGFPTANLRINEKFLPKKGVYTARLKHQGVWHIAVLNIGNKPTFSDSRGDSLEVHVIGKTVELYGEEVVVEWGEFLREEQVFPSVSELKQQIQKDIQKTLNLSFI